MDIARLLETALLDANVQARNEAESQLRALAASNFENYMVYLAGVLESRERPELRMLAALGMKNQLQAKDARVRAEGAARWVALPPDVRQKMKTIALRVLLGGDEQMVASASQLVAAIGTVELPRNEWPDLIPTMIEHTKEDKSVSVKRGCLLAIGYICEAVDAGDAQVMAQLNGILIAIVQCVQANEPDVRVRETALNALINSLGFIKSNFEREGERNYIMQVVCEATQANSQGLQVAAFACLLRIVQLYYAHMLLYMEKALYMLLVSGMKSSDDKVACMAIEFWLTICEEEYDLLLQLHDYQERNEQPPQPIQLYNFCLLASADVLPVLLLLLTRQNEDPEDDDWLVAMAAALCLLLYAATTGMYVVQPTLQFFASNVGGADWRQREAAVMAFGSILEGSDTEMLGNAVQQALGSILALMGDPTLQVADTALWCVGRITEHALFSLNEQLDLPPVLEALLTGLGAHPMVAVNCCWSLINILEQVCAKAPEQDSLPMLVVYPLFVPALVQLSSRGDNEYNARALAYEALLAFVTYLARDTMQLLHNVASEVLGRLEATLTEQFAPRAAVEELQVNILSLLTNIIRRMSLEVASAADKLVAMLLKVLDAQQPNSLIEEDVFVALAAVASAVGLGFLKYMELFVPYLTKALAAPDLPTCRTTVGLVADLAQLLGSDIGHFVPGFMQILGATLSDPLCRRDVKPAVLACFGDLATVVGPQFQPYVEGVMSISLQFSLLQPEDSSFEALDHVNAVREALVDCYVGVVACLADKPDALFGYIGPIMETLEQVATDPELLLNEPTARSAVGLLGDIAAMYQDRTLASLYLQPWVTEFIRATRNNAAFSQSTKEAARWARSRQKRQTQ